MFLNIEGKQMRVRVKHSVMMQHLRIDDSLSSDESNEVSEMRVGDIDHRRDGKSSPLLLLFHYISFISNPKPIRQVPIGSLDYISSL